MWKVLLTSVNLIHMLDRKHRPKVLYWAVVSLQACFFKGKVQCKILRYVLLASSCYHRHLNSLKHLTLLPNSVFFISFP